MSENTDWLRLSVTRPMVDYLITCMDVSATEGGEHPELHRPLRARLVALQVLSEFEPYTDPISD